MSGTVLYIQRVVHILNTFTNNGCDSVATLILTINNSSTSQESATACDSYDWNGTTYTESGTYTFESLLMMDVLMLLSINNQ